MPTASHEARLSRLEAKRKAAIEAVEQLGFAVIKYKIGQDPQDAIAAALAAGMNPRLGFLLVGEIMTREEWMKVAPDQQRKLTEDTFLH